jgi:hypothetical protein
MTGSAVTSITVSRETAAIFGRQMAEIGRRDRAGTLRGWGGRGGAIANCKWE